MRLGKPLQGGGVVDRGSLAFLLLQNALGQVFSGIPVLFLDRYKCFKVVDFTKCSATEFFRAQLRGVGTEVFLSLR